MIDNKDLRIKLIYDNKELFKKEVPLSLTRLMLAS